VETLNVDEAIEYCRLKHESKPQKLCPKNYDTCYLFIDKCREYAYPIIILAKRLMRKEPNPTVGRGMYITLTNSDYISLY